MKILLKKILEKLIMILFVFVILMLIIVILQRATDNSVALGGYRIFTVATGSMVPKYEVGDVLISKEINPDEIKVGDDIAYLGTKESYKGKIVTHRIIDIENKNNDMVIHTKGVSNILEDPVITNNKIYGKVERRLALISIINKTIKNKYGFFFIIFVPLVLVIFLEIADTIVDRKLEKQLLKKRDEEDEII